MFIQRGGVNPPLVPFPSTECVKLPVKSKLWVKFQTRGGLVNFGLACRRTPPPPSFPFVFRHCHRKLARHRSLLRVNAPSARAQIRFLHRFGVSCGFYAPGTSFSKAISVKNLELYICPVENGCGFRPLLLLCFEKFVTMMITE